MVETCGTCTEACWLLCQSCACCPSHYEVCHICLAIPWLPLGEHLLKQVDDDFLLLEESRGALVEEAPVDLPLVLEGSPSLIDELSLSHGRIIVTTQMWFLFPEGGNQVPFPLESSKFLATEQETVPQRARKYHVHKAEVSLRNHGIGFPATVIKEWSMMITQHSDLREQSLVLGAMCIELSSGFHYMSKQKSTRQFLHQICLSLVTITLNAKI